MRKRKPEPETTPPISQVWRYWMKVWRDPGEKEIWRYTVGNSAPGQKTVFPIESGSTNNRELAETMAKSDIRDRKDLVENNLRKRDAEWVEV